MKLCCTCGSTIWVRHTRSSTWNAWHLISTRGTKLVLLKNSFRISFYFGCAYSSWPNPLPSPPSTLVAKVPFSLSLSWTTVAHTASSSSPSPLLPDPIRTPRPTVVNHPAVVNHPPTLSRQSLPTAVDHLPVIDHPSAASFWCALV